MGGHLGSAARHHRGSDPQTRAGHLCGLARRDPPVSTGGSAAAVAPVGSLWEATAVPGPITAPLAGNTSVEVCIVGAGFTGLSAALHLAELGVGWSVVFVVVSLFLSFFFLVMRRPPTSTVFTSTTPPSPNVAHLGIPN